MASRLKPKVPKDFERFLREGRGESNSKCVYEIGKDVNRTFPYLKYFRDSSLG